MVPIRFFLRRETERTRHAIQSHRYGSEHRTVPLRRCGETLKPQPALAEPDLHPIPSSEGGERSSLVRQDRQSPFKRVLRSLGKRVVAILAAKGKLVERVLFGEHWKQA
jgi:hypothetical protein